MLYEWASVVGFGFKLVSDQKEHKHQIFTNIKT